MTNFYTLIESLEGDLENLATIRAEIEKLGLSELRRLLKDNGLNNADKINDKTVAADLALSLFSPKTRSPRSNETKSVEGLIAGKVYDDDDDNVIHRLATKERDKIQIWKVTESQDGQLNMARDCEFDAHQAGACMAPGSEEEDEPDVTPHPDKVYEEDGPVTAPEDPPSVPPTQTSTHYEEEKEDEPDVTPPEPAPPPEPTPIVSPTQTSTHYKVDIKVVHWIPFRTNDLAIPSQLLPTAWSKAKMSQEVRMATRRMLSTGNAPPPNNFPNKASWNTFVNSKEYRAIFWAQLYICCPSGDPKSSPVKMHKAGFTPHPSKIKESPANTLAKRLEKDHKRRQTLGSQVEGFMAGNGVVGKSADTLSGSVFPWFIQWGVHDQIDDALAELRKKYKGKKSAPECYSEGKDKFEPPKDQSTKNCVAGLWSYFFRVGESHNLLNYMLTGSLIPYQGGDMYFSLCCHTKKLLLRYNYTTVPSFKVYVNNDTAGQYDMMKSKFSSMHDSISGDELDSLDRFSRPKLPPANIWSTSVKIPGESGCKPIPKDWWPKPKAKLY